ncbi:MAG: ferrous iron transport protein B [Planctomycetota bacterium]|nr:MAG: ferrous iron transport protein B [Planctomycetota bacterium]
MNTHSADGTLSPRDPLIVALLGNPNTGKSTLFSALAGIATRVGNYPGVTVEEKIGQFTHHNQVIKLIDLPGTYSLFPKSPDETVAVNVLRGQMPGVPLPDCVIVVADATNLERNLYLASQVLEIGLPTVIALTLCDLADEKGIVIDTALLAQRLGCPVVRVIAPTHEGIAALCDNVIAAPATLHPSPITLDRDFTAANTGHSLPAREAMARYAWIERQLSGVITKTPPASRSFDERIDAVLTHRGWGTLIFIATMLLVFTSIFWLATPLMDLISSGMDGLATGVESLLPPGAIRSLIVNGVLAGIGGVVVFLPQIAMLFFFVAILEGCGYLSRAAFLMDRLLYGVGLSGKSFIPLLSSFACAIPGIMAARTIENRRDRLLTILVAPLMSCSARLPVYLLLCGAFVPNVAVGVPWLRLPALVLAAMYAVGVVVAALVALVLTQTVFRGPPQPFVMELPGWRWPRASVVWERVREASWSFLQNAGTLIVAVSIVVWALASYPYSQQLIEAEVDADRQKLVWRLSQYPPTDPDRVEIVDQLASLETADGLEAARRGAAQRQSFLGRAGRFIEPVVKPLGWDWRIGCAAIASFPAREVVLGTLGVIYNLGEIDPGEEDGSTALVRRLRAATWDGTNRKVYTLPVALSIMIFFALCAQCASTLVVIAQETNSWVWPVVAFTYMTLLAWLGAFATYQIGSAFDL